MNFSTYYNAIRKDLDKLTPEQLQEMVLFMSQFLHDSETDQVVNQVDELLNPRETETRIKKQKNKAEKKTAKDIEDWKTASLAGMSIQAEENFEVDLYWDDDAEDMYTFTDPKGIGKKVQALTEDAVECVRQGNWQTAQTILYMLLGTNISIKCTADFDFEKDGMTVVRTELLPADPVEPAVKQTVTAMVLDQQLSEKDRFEFTKMLMETASVQMTDFDFLYKTGGSKVMLSQEFMESWLMEILNSSEYPASSKENLLFETIRLFQESGLNHQELIWKYGFFIPYSYLTYYVSCYTDSDSAQKKQYLQRVLTVDGLTPAVRSNVYGLLAELEESDDPTLAHEYRIQEFIADPSLKKYVYMVLQNPEEDYLQSRIVQSIQENIKDEDEIAIIKALEGKPGDLIQMLEEPSISFTRNLVFLSGILCGGMINNRALRRLTEDYFEGSSSWRTYRDFDMNFGEMTPKEVQFVSSVLFERAAARIQWNQDEKIELIKCLERRLWVYTSDILNTQDRYRYKQCAQMISALAYLYFCLGIPEAHEQLLNQYLQTWTRHSRFRKELKKWME